MLQFAALDVVQLVAIEVGHHRGRGDAQRLLPVDIPGHNIVAMEQSLQKGNTGNQVIWDFIVWVSAVAQLDGKLFSFPLNADGIKMPFNKL